MRISKAAFCLRIVGRGDFPEVFNFPFMCFGLEMGCIWRLATESKSGIEKWGQGDFCFPPALGILADRCLSLPHTHACQSHRQAEETGRGRCQHPASQSCTQLSSVADSPSWGPRRRSQLGQSLHQLVGRGWDSRWLRFRKSRDRASLSRVPRDETD